jgi:hypothetical protein
MMTVGVWILFSLIVFLFVYAIIWTFKNCKPSIYEETRRDYEELIYAVGHKYTGETRHQTALRYIREAENKKIEAGEYIK